jgi:HK97 family phage portal protein
MLKDRLGIPRELHIRRPDRMIPKIEKGIIAYYIYKEGLKEVIYPKEDILYFRYPNPIDPYRGASPVQRKAYAYDTDKYNMIYQLNMFKNGAHLKAVLETAANINEDQAKKIWTLFNQTYGGVENSNKTGILTSGLTYKTTGMSNKDMEFMLLAEWTMRQLASAYHTPPQKLSHPESTNLANMDALDTAWNRECILPRLTRQEQVYDSFLLPLYKEDGLYCKYDNPVPVDKDFELRKRDSNLLHFVITPNEARVEDGYEEVPWGKVPLVPFNIMPLSSGGNGGNEPEPIKAIIKKERTEEYKENYWKVFIKKVTPLENEFRRGVTKLFQEQENEALRALRKGKAIVKDIDDVLRVTHNEREISKFADFALPRITETVRLNGTESFAELGIEGSFDVSNPEVVKWIKKRCGTLIKGISDTTLDKLKITLTEGIEAGESIPKLASRISAVYEEAKGTRAEKIARTETIAASNQGALQAYKQSGVVEKKEFYCAIDERTCDECISLHKEIIGLDDSFSNGMDSPPIHPNCRCVVLPVISE